MEKERQSGGRLEKSEMHPFCKNVGWLGEWWEEHLTVGGNHCSGLEGNWEMWEVSEQNDEPWSWFLRQLTWQILGSEGRTGSGEASLEDKGRDAVAMLV